MNKLSIRLPDDLHVHARQGPPMAAYVARTAASFGRFLAMPNVVPPLSSGRAVADYLAALRSAAVASGQKTEPLVAFKLVPGMGADAVRACAEAGAVAGKYYPAGATTNSADGVRDPSEIRGELEAMEAAGIVLSIHGEDPDKPDAEREEAFLPTVDRVVAAYPRLRVVVEHLSCAASVRAVLSWPGRVAATITAHHLAFAAADAAADSAFVCKPCLKAPGDRVALVEAAISGSPKFFFGSDSAPHPAAAKASGASGVYAAPVALGLLAATFEDVGALDRLEAFVSERGAAFYGLPPNEGLLDLERRPWTVAEEYDGVRPPAVGRVLSWSARRR